MRLWKLSLVPIILGVAMSSMAQVEPSPGDLPGTTINDIESQGAARLPEAVKETMAAVVSVEKYCSNAENFSQSQPSRLFAEVPSGNGEPPAWTAFSTEAQWDHAGGPAPRARVWYSDGKVVLVRMMFDKGREFGSDYNYCYGANGRIARIAAVPTKQIQCDDSYLQCVLISGFERLYLPDGKKVNVLNNFDSRLLKSEKTIYATSKETPPEYLNVSELPFARLLR